MNIMVQTGSNSLNHDEDIQYANLIAHLERTATDYDASHTIICAKQQSAHKSERDKSLKDQDSSIMDDEDDNMTEEIEQTEQENSLDNTDTQKNDQDKEEGEEIELSEEIKTFIHSIISEEMKTKHKASASSVTSLTLPVIEEDTEKKAPPTQVNQTVLTDSSGHVYLKIS